MSGRDASSRTRSPTLTGVISATFVLNLAYFMLVSSTFTRRILWLRGALVVAGVTFVIYGFMADNWTMIFWNSVTSVLHAAQGFRFIKSQRSVQLAPGDEEIRETWFSTLGPFDFQSLWTMGETVEYADGTLAVEGQPQTMMVLVLDGSATVDVEGREVGLLQRGDLVGEMSFLSGTPASATVIPQGTVRVREWDQARLRTLDHLNPSAATAVRRLIQENLADKLIKRSR